LEFDILDSSRQISNALLDNTGHNSISGATDFSGQDSAENKLDRMMVFLHNMHIKQEETVSRSKQKLLKKIHAVATDHDVFKAEVCSEIKSLRLLLGQSSSVNHSSFQIGQSHSSNFSPQTISSTIPAVQSPSISYSPTITNVGKCCGKKKATSRKMKMFPQSVTTVSSHLRIMSHLRSRK
jgi:hypothetical protein